MHTEVMKFYHKIDEINLWLLDNSIKSLIIFITLLAVCVGMFSSCSDTSSSPDNYLDVGDSVVFVSSGFTNEKYTITINDVRQEGEPRILIPKGVPQKGDIGTVVYVDGTSIEIKEFPMYRNGKKCYWSYTYFLKEEDYNEAINRK